ncbi:hypothetical protein LguiA_033238 [Lonicera macranthoides]
MLFLVERNPYRFFTTSVESSSQVGEKIHHQICPLLAYSKSTPFLTLPIPFLQNRTALRSTKLWKNNTPFSFGWKTWPGSESKKTKSNMHEKKKKIFLITP